MVTSATIKKGYKQTELGVIPEDWDLKPLGQISDVFMGQSPSGTTYNKNGEGIALINGPTEFTDVSPVKVQWTTQPTKICKADDLLICVRGSSTGRMNIADDEYCIGRGVAAIRAKASSNTVYLANQIHLGIEKLLALSAGSTFPNIDGKSIRSIKIPLPPTLAEQTAIATILSDTNALIVQLEKLIAKKKAIKQGMMQSLLKPKKGWEVKKMGEVATLKARIGWQGLTTAEYRKSGDYFLITGTEFKNGFIDWENCFYVEDERYKQDKNIQIKEHDVLVTKDGTIGKVALIKSVPKPATLNSGVFVIRPINNSFVPEFFYYLLLSEIFLRFLSQLSAGSTINHLYQKDFVSFQFLTPKTMEEQKRIAQILSDMDAEIENLEQKRDKYTMLKQGMMQQLLTGRIRIHATK